MGKDECWEKFLKHFQLVAFWNRWGPADMAEGLYIALHGPQPTTSATSQGVLSWTLDMGQPRVRSYFYLPRFRHLVSSGKGAIVVHTFVARPTSSIGYSQNRISLIVEYVSGR